MPVITPDVLAAFPEFDGESVSLVEYTSTFNRILNSLSLSSSQAFVILPVKLKGKAARVYEEIEKEDKVEDYQSLLNELLRRLTTDTSKIKARCELAMKMKEGESLSDFATRVRRNVKNAYPTVTNGLDETLMSDTFLRGLPSSLYKSMMGKTYSKLNEALDVAEQRLLMIQLCKNDGMEDRIVEKVTEALVNTSVNYVSNNGSGHSYRGNSLVNNRFGEYSRNNWHNRSYNRRNSRHDYGTDDNYVCRNWYDQDGRGNFNDNDRERFDEQGGELHSHSDDREQFEDEVSRQNDDQWRNNEDHREDDGHYQGRSSPFYQVNVIMISLCIIGMFVSSTNGQSIAYNCTHRDTMAMLFAPQDDSYKCVAKWNNGLTVHTTAHIFRENVSDFTVDAYACSDIISRITVSSFFRIFNLTIEAETVERPVSRVECMDRKKTKTTREGKLHEVSPGFWKTDIEMLPLLPYFGTYTSTTTHRILQYGKIFAVQPDLLVSSIGNMKDCRMENGFCMNSNKSLVWNAPQKSEQCFESIGQYKVLINDGVVIIPELRKILYPKTKFFARNLCSKLNVLALSAGFHINLPEFPKISSFSELVSNAKGGRIRLVEKHSSSLSPSVSHLETAFPFPGVQKEINVNFDYELGEWNINRVYLDTCEEQKWLREKLIDEMQIHPTLAVQTLLNRADVTADKIDSSIYRIYLCDTVRIDSLEHSRQVNGSNDLCFTYQPVKIEGQLRFLNEDTQQIHQQSPTMNCSEISVKKRRNTKKNREDIHKQPTITQIEDDGNPSVPLFGFLQMGMQSIEDYKENISSWDKIKYGLNKIKEKGVLAAKEGSSRAVNIATEIKEKIVHYATSWITFIHKAILGVLICAVVGAIGYVVFKYRLWKEITSCCLASRGKQIVHKSISNPSINFIGGNRAPNSPSSRFRRLLETRERADAIELMKYRVTRVSTLPQTEVLITSDN